MKNQFDRLHAKRIPEVVEGGQVLVQTGYKGKEPMVKGPFRVRQILFKNNYPKTIIYEDESGQKKFAATKNVLPFHCRGNEVSQGGECGHTSTVEDHMLAT